MNYRYISADETVTQGASIPEVLRDSTMRSLSFCDLPVELGVEILDFLRGDSQALYSCCLTSKLWFKLAQPILYKSICINDVSFCDTVRELPTRPSHIQKLNLDGLSSAPPPTDFLPRSIGIQRVVGMELPNPWVITVLLSRTYDGVI